MTTMLDGNPLADQIEAAMDEGMRRCSANRHLVEDDRLSDYVHSMRSPWADPDGSPLSPKVTVHESSFLEVFCDRCEAPAEAGSRTVEMASGSTVVQIRCCARCVAYLDRDFAPVQWLP